MPYYNLGISSSTYGGQFGSMLKSIEEVLLKEKLDGMLIYAGTTPPLSGALVSARLTFL